jgi:hypothetical protein
MPNVFISYRSADSVEARQLADDLTAEGHDVWVDQDEVHIGDSIIQKMNEGLEGTTYLVLCLSSSGVNAPWISREWMSTLARQLSGHSVKVLPVRLTGTDLPAILADIKYADLVTDRAKGLNDLKAVLR